MRGRTPAEQTPHMDEEASLKRPLPTGRQRARSRASLEREIEHLSRRVDELEREKADIEAFAALAAHEMVEPLIMAEAFAAMVSERLHTDDHADSRADLAALSRGAARVRLLVEALLHDARARTGGIPRRYVDLDAVVHDCLTLLGPEIASRSAHVELAPLPTVWGEEASLAGVFTNLLVNALKYSPRQGAHDRHRRGAGERRLAHLGPERGPHDPGGGSRAHLRAVQPRARRAPRPRRRARARHLPAHRRAPRRPASASRR